MGEPAQSVDDMMTAPHSLPMLLSAHVDGWIAYAGYTGNSVRQRRQLVGQFLVTIGDPEPTGLTVDHCLDWWSTIGHLAPASRHSHLAAVRRFMAYLVARRIITGDPTAGIIGPKIPSDPPVVLSTAEIVTLITSMQCVRDRCIVALMLGCGLRAAEVASVRVEDIDLVRRQLAVIGKGSRRRQVPVPQLTADCITAWLAERPMIHGQLIRRLYGTGGPVRADYVAKRVSSHLTALGIKRGAWDGRSSHVLRRTCATTLLEEGASIRDVQTVLGHTQLSSTERYLAVPNVTRLLEIVDRGPMAVAARWSTLSTLPPAA